MTEETGGTPTLFNLSQKDELRGAVENLRRSLPVRLEYAELQAKMRRTAFLALVKEGFTEAQALDLCWRQ